MMRALVLVNLACRGAFESFKPGFKAGSPLQACLYERAHISLSAGHKTRSRAICACPAPLHDALPLAPIPHTWLSETNKPLIDGLKRAHGIDARPRP